MIGPVDFVYVMIILWYSVLEVFIPEAVIFNIFVTTLCKKYENKRKDLW